MKRLIDFILALASLVVFAIPLLLVSIAVKLTSKGPILYWSERVGRDNQLFWMPKFRSMKVGTPQLATHLLTDASSRMTVIGNFIRLTSLDELPQLWSVLAGHMSFVGPRPALFNQDDLIEERTKRGIHTLRPGVTGWAQINGRDELSIPEKVAFDEQYLHSRSIWLDLRIMFRTVIKVSRQDGIRQADSATSSSQDLGQHQKAA